MLEYIGTLIFNHVKETEGYEIARWSDTASIEWEAKYHPIEDEE